MTTETEELRETKWTEKDGRRQTEREGLKENGWKPERERLNGKGWKRKT